MSESASVEETSRGKPSFLAWGCGTTLCILICLFLTVLLTYRNRQLAYARSYEETLAKIRERKEPTNSEELTAMFSPAPGEENLAIPLLKIIDRIDVIREQNPGDVIPLVGNVSTNFPAPHEEWPDRAASEQYLALYAAPLAELQDLLKREGVYHAPLDYSQGFSLLLPHLTKYRHVARIYALRYYVESRSGRWPEARAALVDSLRFAKTLEKDPLLIGHLVGIACFQMNVGPVADYLRYGEPSDADLDELSQLLASCDFRQGLKNAYLGERAIVIETVEHQTLADMANFAASGPPDATQDLIKRFAPRNSVRELRPGDCQRLIALQSDIIEACNGDLSQSLTKILALEAQLKKLTAEEQDQFIWDRHILTSMFLPAGSQVAQSSCRAAATRDCMITAIAIKRHQRALGALPTKLEELCPRFMPAVPNDPFSGKPLLYLREEENFVVYSVGKNGIDDGGKIESQDDNGIRVGDAPASNEP